MKNLMNLNKETVIRLWVQQFGKKQKATDFSGREIAKAAYNDRNSKYGWNVDHILPLSRGGKTADHKGHINLGTCKDCSLNNPVVAQKVEEQAAKIHAKYDSAICPECGGRLRERNGRYGRFMGCSNYPTCRYSYRIR